MDQNTYCVVTFKVPGGLKSKSPSDWELAGADPEQTWARPGALGLASLLAEAGTDGYRLVEIQALSPDRGRWMVILEKS